MTQTVLFVDDDPNLTAGVKRLLRNEPYRILTEDGAEAALERLRTEPVDVVVSDEQMPGMDGAEFLAALRRQHPAIVSIMLSGQASMGAVIRALNEGQIFRFLIKPCGHDELTANIRQALAHKQMLDRCRRLLPLFRRQCNLLHAIERQHPGISRLMEGEVRTNIVLKQADFRDVDELVQCLDVEIRRGEEFFA
jgi:DNA-binding NtrC family response regulator